MTINGISSASGALLTQQTRRPPAPPAMNTTAQLLGTTAEDLNTTLAKGDTTLTKLAADKGISSDDLLKSIKADLQANKPADAPELSDSQLTAFAGKVAEGKGPGGPHGPGGPGGPPPAGGAHGARSNSSNEDTDSDSKLSTLANALGTDKDSLVEMLSSVQDLGTLLSRSGVTGYGSAGTGIATSGLAVDQYA